MSFIIIEQNINAGPFRKGVPVSNLSVGTIKIENTGVTAFTLNAGTEIGGEWGLIFSIENTTTINPNSTSDVEIVVNGTPTVLGSGLIIIAINGIENPDIIPIFFIVTAGCEKFVAIVVDESASISEVEAEQIRTALKSFLYLESWKTTTLSLIGMSSSDSDSRTDHIIQTKIVNNYGQFINWIDDFGAREIDIQSDYWASGLEVVNNLTVTPDIVIVITDGLQVNNTSILQNLYSTLNQKSHIFVYGVMGNYQEATGWTELVTPLSFYLGRTPVLKTSTNSILTADYVGFSDFSALNAELIQLSTDLATAKVGCFANVEIIEEKLVYPVLKAGIAIHQEAGSLLLKNKSRINLILEEGTLIHDTEAALGGLVFTLSDTVTIPANSQLEVVIRIDGTPTNSGIFPELITLENVNNPSGFSISFTITSGCERYIAIIVDESGSIDETEAVQIRAGLTSFINSQFLSNTTLSLIGMSHSDMDSRTDHIIQKRISHHQQEFLDWISDFSTIERTINAQSDYWASGLEVVNSLTVTPDIIIVVTDGLQVDNDSTLQNLFITLNQKSHVFVYGVTSSSYNTSAQYTDFTDLIPALNHYLNRIPVLKTNANSILNADFIELSDFSTLNTELNQLSTDLANANIGCMANVEIIENNLVYPVLNSGVRIHQQAGSLLLKNKSRIPLILEQGTLIHNADAALSGMVFTLRDNVSVEANAQLEVFVLIDGTPLHSGSYSGLIIIENITNPNGFTIDFTVGNDFSTVDIADDSSLQSPSLSLLVAGSKGNDSTKGIHLRWVFPGSLGENHLPKGDLFTGTPFGYNKPDDFVKVYRSPYIKTPETTTTISLHSAPTLVDNSNALWIYKDAKQRLFYVYFKNKSKYASIYPSIIEDPMTNPVGFLEAYGNELIEIENNKDLFFAANLSFSSPSNSGKVRLESLSVAENTIKAAKTVSSRKTHNWIPSNPIRVVAENGRSIRFRATDCIIDEIDFELYSDFIQQANENETWVSKGKYGLSLDDLKVFGQLEPKFGAVHGKWLKYNDGEYVNTKNYRERWNNSPEPGDKNIKEVVDSYVKLSNNPNNPRATEYISLIAGNENDSDETKQIPSEDKAEISNLDLLNIAANDFHIARMLGLGALDIDESVFSGDYIYLTEYTTFEGVNSESEPIEVQHLAMSIPVSVDKERLPLPVELDKIVPGLNLDSESEATSVKTTDENGYGFDGKKRYLSLLMKDVMELGYKVPFFETPLEYDASSFTFPVYAGVKYKLDNELSWRKPEIARDLEYSNVNKKLERASYEPSPIIIPEAQKPLINLRQEEVGKHIYWYQGYGVNLFSRAATGSAIFIESDIKPKNTLIAPSSVNPLLIVKEDPLMFTSQNEQTRYDLIASDDKTYIRVLLDYYSVQELQTYNIPDEMSFEEAVENADAIFKDDDEIYAEDIELFFRDSLPLGSSGKITNVADGESTITSVLTLENYTLASTGETVDLGLNQANAQRFVGGVLTIANENYVIQEIQVIQHTNDENEVVVDDVKVHVLKKEVTASILSDGIATENSEQLQEVKIPNNALCTLVENMLTPTNWNPAGPMDFKVAIPEVLTKVHREIIQISYTEGNSENILEKTRGIWEEATIEQIEEKLIDADGNYVLDQEGNEIKKHLGNYKITFPNYSLAKHPDDKGDAIENSVEWANGIVRLFTKSCLLTGNPYPVKSRKEFRVVRTEKIGTTNDLELYIKDTDFKLEGNGSTYTMDPNYDEIIVGDQLVNYYPRYRVYLFKNEPYGITKEAIQPREGESTHYSIVGVRSHMYLPGYNEHYYSKISVPSPMHAVEVIAPLMPKGLNNPSGSRYATRPDFFKRSTYTFVTEYGQKPHGVLHYRANDEALLSVLYEQNTILQIREELNKRGGNNEIISSARWQNFLNFEELEATGVYNSFQDLDSREESYSFPMPDNEDFITGINEFVDWHNETNLPEGVVPAKIIDASNPLLALNQVVIPKEKGIVEDLLVIYFIEQVIHAVFVPLTEVPVIYDLIDVNRSADYVPSAKKQTIKDKNGHILKATDPDFDMAPMMKIVPPVEAIPPAVTNAAATQFTDFNIDGTSNNLYFYGVREMDVKMNFGSFSPFLGPIKLVNSNPPQSPEIKRIMPVLENTVLGINPAIQIELNPYHPEHNIKKISIYRALSMFDAQAIRTMKLVKEIVVDESILAADFDNVWQIYDEFEDVESIPFGEGLFYRITVSREIEYEEYDFDSQVSAKVIDYTPSQPSKITATIIADNVSPESPVLQASGILAGIDDTILESVMLHWEKTVHNGKYHLYKMNNQGNWDKIHEIISNENENQLPLVETQWGSDTLTIKNEDGEKTYHHFKLIAENSSGMYSSEEKILSLYNDNLTAI